MSSRSRNTRRPELRFLVGALLLAACTLTSIAPGAASAALPAGVERVKQRSGIENYRLTSNGLDILLVPNHSAPVFTIGGLPCAIRRWRSAARTRAMNSSTPNGFVM